MKVGLSTYSLARAIQSGEMDVLQAMDWIKENGGEHVEIVPFGFDLVENPQLINQIRAKADAIGLEISNYAIGANFITESDEDYRKEIDRVKQHVDIAHQLGVSYMRHDVASRPPFDIHIQMFEEDLPKLVSACQAIADYAAQYGITTNVENHGYFIQASDRVQRLVDCVNRFNYKTVLDVGNFLCVDEEPVVAVKKNLPYASVVHFKDFYYRPESKQLGEGWMRTASGNYLRGAIVGHGDIDIPAILSIIKDSGFDGYISVEFEGMEDCKLGSRLGMAYVRKLWGEQ
ncbi:sugar phosphate isomerase/epimerase family protein [Radiobacillus sp. PE A8.2]|uniref:sugar phosphate isomerase/epimerase family protein n=1 Tax=Radiobacillus sp. PE A8.2 TaxID=3380349 RepID=UPI00388E527C